MKNIKYIIYSLITIFMVISCGDSGIDVRLSSSDFFVAFDTKNGVFAAETITEGDTAIVGISIGATKGKSVSVEFDLLLPTVENPQSAAYKLLTMDDQEITEKKLTFPEGTGIQKFKFVALDNDIVGDGTRVFTFKLVSNSAGYTIGVGTKGEASEYKVTVLDDDIWSSIGTGTFIESFAFGADVLYNVEIQKALGEERYRLITPYKEGLVTEDWWDGTNGPNYVEFWITEGDLIQFTTYAIGLNYQGVATQPIKAYYPTDFNASLSISYNKKTGEKTYQLAPYYYIDGVGGWNYTERDGMIVITLP